MNWFRKKRQETNDITVVATPVSLPQLRIFGLSTSLDLIGFTLTKTTNNNSTVLLPTVTRNGRVSRILGGTPSDFESMRIDVKQRFDACITELYRNRKPDTLSLGQFLVVGYNLTTEEELASGTIHLIYEALVNPKPMDELGHIYSLLEEPSGDSLTSFFSSQDSQQVWWLNEVISSLEKMLDWPSFVKNSEQMWYEKYRALKKEGEPKHE